MNVNPRYSAGCKQSLSSNNTKTRNTIQPHRFRIIGDQNRYIVVHQPFQFSVPRSLTRSRIYSHTIRRTLASNVYILLIINMDDTERRTAKRSRFDQKEPEPKRTSRFDRRSRSPPARKFESRRSRSPIRRRSSRSPARESIKKDDVDPAAAAGIHTT